MQHLLAFTGTLGAASAVTAVPVVADPIIRNATATAFNAPTRLKVYGAYLQSATFDFARLNTPRMRYISLPRLCPGVVGTLPGTQPPFVDMRNYPAIIDQNDQFGVDMADTGVGVAGWAFLWVGTDISPAVRGDASTLMATSTTAAVANVWTPITLTFADTIPQGVYDVIGVRYVAAASIAGRILPPGGGWRPGCIGCASEAQDDLNRFRKGEWGTLTSFDAAQPIGFEVFCTGATAVHRVFFDVVRRGGFGPAVP